MPIHLVIHLRSSYLKNTHLSQGQVTLREILVKFQFHFDHTVIIIIPKNIRNTPLVVVYYNTKLVYPH